MHQLIPRPGQLLHIPYRETYLHAQTPAPVPHLCNIHLRVPEHLITWHLGGCVCPCAGFALHEIEGAVARTAREGEIGEGFGDGEHDIEFALKTKTIYGFVEFLAYCFEGGILWSSVEFFEHSDRVGEVFGFTRVHTKSHLCCAQLFLLLHGLEPGPGIPFGAHHAGAEGFCEGRRHDIGAHNELMNSV